MQPTESNRDGASTNVVQVLPRSEPQKQAESNAVDSAMIKRKRALNSEQEFKNHLQCSKKAKTF